MLEAVNTIEFPVHGALRCHRAFPNAGQVIWRIFFTRIMGPTQSEVRTSFRDDLTMGLVLAEGRLWTDESVFWQNKLKDRERYEVVYRKSLTSTDLSSRNRETVVLPISTDSK